MRKTSQDHQREGWSLAAHLAITSGTEIGGAATPRSFRRTFQRDRSYCPRFHKLVRTRVPLPLGSSKFAGKCAVWRVQKKRKGVKQVLKLFAYADSLRRNEDGQTMAEYGVVLAVITLAIIATLTLLGTNVEAKIGEVVEALNPTG
jgi:pilus assembly protein Flp/PilA